MVMSPVVECNSIGEAGALLDPDALTRWLVEQTSALDLAGKKVCVVVPDATRACPLPLLAGALLTGLAEAAEVTFLIALGTHAPMDDQAIAAHLGLGEAAVETPAPRIRILNHAWWEHETLVSLGTIGSDRIRELSGAAFGVSVPVLVNRLIVESDLVVLAGPVLPHEVVGFSGGTKYLFPGVSEGEMIDVSHWLGALITSSEIIGTLGLTPVRQLIDQAAALVPTPCLGLSFVTRHGGHDLCFASFGPPAEAWARASRESAATHITYLDAPRQRVLSLIPRRYEDMWTGAKGFYKVEPVVADGGEVVIFAPHITQLSVMHPGIAEIGYHCKDYFLANWQRYKDRPWGELAHSTHLAGKGTYDPATGEHLRVRLSLATGVPEKVVRSAGLGYLDPASIDPARWAEDQDTLVVHDAGEDLYRLRPDAG